MVLIALLSRAIFCWRSENVEYISERITNISELEITRRFSYAHTRKGMRFYYARKEVTLWNCHSLQPNLKSC